MYTTHPQFHNSPHMTSAGLPESISRSRTIVFFSAIEKTNFLLFFEINKFEKWKNKLPVAETQFRENPH